MAEEKVFVSFACQRCMQPLKLDDSLNSFGEHLLAELTCKCKNVLQTKPHNTLFIVIVPIHSNPDVDLESTATSYDHYVHPCRLSDSGNGVNGFTVITDENGTEIETLSNQIKVCCILCSSRIVLGAISV